MTITKISALVVIASGLIGALAGATESRICLLGPNTILRRFGPDAAYRACLAVGLCVELVGLYLYFFVGL
jgi:hypothetical protein